jgi:hypothetical protein
LCALVHTALGEHEWAIHWAAGRAMSLDIAMTFALAGVRLTLDV